MASIFDKPLSDRCSNPGRYDYWTCPGCYGDLGDIGTGLHTCPHCERQIECEIDHEPVCITRLTDACDQEG